MKNEMDLRRYESSLLNAWAAARDMGNLQLSVHLWNRLIAVREQIAALNQGERKQ